ncbi:MAG: hypothetical protein J7K23_04330 [Thermoproteales archaeon]|nr:hypothetical protein [Thermoproteales archaeon]
MSFHGNPKVLGSIKNGKFEDVQHKEIAKFLFEAFYRSKPVVILDLISCGTPSHSNGPPLEKIALYHT